MRKTNPSFAELSELIVNAIIEEPFFKKEILVPKIKSVITAFNLKLNNIKLDSVTSETDKSRLLKEIYKQDFERKFWMQKIRDNFPEKINEYYQELDELTKKNKTQK